MADRPANHSYRAAHSLIAGALAALGRDVTNSIEPLVEHPVFIVIGLIVVIGLVAGRIAGLVL